MLTKQQVLHEVEIWLNIREYKVYQTLVHTFQKKDKNPKQQQQ
jgi:hypothetical protein